MCTCPGRHEGSFTIATNTQVYGAGNAATTSGTGIYLTPVALVTSTVTNSLISRNSNAFGSGGDIYVTAAHVTVASTEISNNMATDGGGVYFTGALG